MVLKIALIYVVLMTSYYVLTQKAHLSADYAETNLQAGLLKLQTLYNAGDGFAATIGSSMIAKLPTDEVFNGFSKSRINLGIDGGSGLYAIEKLLDSGKKQGVVVIEANGLLIMQGNNMQTLDDAYNSKTYSFSKWLPVFSKEYRPSSIVYSGLKKLKDRAEGGGNIDVPIHYSPAVEYPEKGEDHVPGVDEVYQLWSAAVDRLYSRDYSIVLVMIPDGDTNRYREYKLARSLAASYGLPFVDIKSKAMELPVSYTDGTHLNHFSAILVARLLNRSLMEISGQN